MSEHIESTTSTGTTDTDSALGRMRLLPTVAFASRASALARAALPVAVMAVGLVSSGSAGEVHNLITMDTTCCPPQA